MSEYSRAVAVSFTNPATARRQTPRGVWYASGLGADDMGRLETATDPAAAGDIVVGRVRDASVVYVELDGGAPVRVKAWKGLLGVHEVFYARLPDGRWYLTDHFHNVMAVLPEGQRAMTDETLLRHYVSAAVYGRETYARGADRVANGDRLDIDLVAGEATVQIFSRHTAMSTDEPMEIHLGRLDAALEDVVGSLRTVPGLGVGFSGGVDSTLLLTYLGTHGIPLTVVPGSPEFDAETEYARSAAHLLRRDIVEIQLDEADYLHNLEHSIESLGMPLESYIVPVLARLYEHDSPLFVIGEGADSVFGSGRGIRRLASLLSGRAGLEVLRRLEGDGRLGRRARQIGEYAARFAEPPSSPRGYAGTALNYYGDMSGTVRMYGEEAIAALDRTMLQEVFDRVELETAEGDRFARHIEIAQWRVIFSDLALAGNHDAHAIGKRQVNPYLSWRVVSEHLKVPARARYYKGFTGKWMLKELLIRRVDGYPVNKRKLATSLPFERYLARGPLTGIWDRYDIPEAVPAELWPEVRTKATPLTWKAITHAIWQDRVVANPNLEPHPAAVADSWSFPGAG
ncbi:MAG: asparagine synthase-related protein [Acidimicrobiia bacterium]